jgi:hypothetical protein
VRAAGNADLDAQPEGVVKTHDPNFRCRDLLDAIKQLPCTFQIEDVCVGGPTSQPCHSNFAKHGKGKSLKAHDCYVAAGCDACHRELDQGHKLSRDERVELFQRAFEKTLLLLWQRGLLQVRRGGLW